ncbi:uncharacterized protein [Physcomitrium patens]|uniref:Uncharacterized protein n=1 Tax=Physcomitrium patens TaxID=3218 RepID=A0A2K1L320_PHYPA|nr:uncharacterized protein LOC112293375 [Physcomitrium patens]PNR60424.1 hypothetical protein PHYPA_003217 [Physcomitrium patens]|eukprot:XP_024398461.1 uncharacterized protein LOC112293375 [Physcomitrella patens]
MATLLMRSSEVAAVEKLTMASREQVRLQQEKVPGHFEQEGPHKVSSEGRSRGRKVKNAQKKPPQRGLGVAQLERLRLQEQSKQEAACLASIQVLPSFSFTDHNGGICVLPLKSGTVSHQQPGLSSALSFNNGRTGPSEKLHYLAEDGHQLGKVAVDGEGFQSIMSFANSDHSTAGTFARHAQGGQSIALIFSRNREIREHSYGCNSMRTVPSLSSLSSLSERPGSRGLGSCGTSAYAEGSSGKFPPCVQGCHGSPPSSTAKSSLLSNALTTGVNLVDSLASNAEQGKQRLSEMDRESVYMFQVTSNGVGDAGMVDAKLFPAVGKNGAVSLFTSNNLQCFESSSGPAKLRRLPQDRAEVPVAGVVTNCGRPKELSSFQSFSSNNTWSASEKICGQKRPWYDLNENTSKSMHSEGLDLNAPVGKVEAVQSGCYASLSQGHESTAGIHHTAGITGSGLDNTLPLLKDKACAALQENEAQNLSTTTDVDYHSVESFLKVSCPTKSKIKDCCSSVCSPCESPITRQRCLSSSEVPMLMEADHETSGDFLTLGISTRSYPISPQLGVEVNSKESMNHEDSHQVKRIKNFQDDALQLQMFNHREESAPSVTDGIHSPCTDTSFFSAVGLSCRFTSTSSSNVSEVCLKLTGREEKRDFLDLNLKLAL